MITATTNVNELKNFEGEWHNKCELEIAIENDDRLFGWSGELGGVEVWNHKCEVVGFIETKGTEVFEW